MNLWEFPKPFCVIGKPIIPFVANEREQKFVKQSQLNLIQPIRPIQFIEVTKTNSSSVNNNAESDSLRLMKWICNTWLSQEGHSLTLASLVFYHLEFEFSVRSGQVSVTPPSPPAKKMLTYHLHMWVSSLYPCKEMFICLCVHVYQFISSPCS